MGTQNLEKSFLTQGICGYFSGGPWISLSPTSTESRRFHNNLLAHHSWSNRPPPTADPYTTRSPTFECRARIFPVLSPYFEYLSYRLYTFSLSNKYLLVRYKSIFGKLTHNMLVFKCIKAINFTCYPSSFFRVSMPFFILLMGIHIMQSDDIKSIPFFSARWSD
jgi:hypothetical protein